MNIEDETLKINCPNCNEQIILTFHTVKCPKCDTKFDSEQVKQIFYNYESNLQNNKLYQTSQKAGKTFDSMQKTGKSTSSFGTTLIIITLLIIIILLLLL